MEPQAKNNSGVPDNLQELYNRIVAFFRLFLGSTVVVIIAGAIILVILLALAILNGF